MWEEEKDLSGVWKFPVVTAGEKKKYFVFPLSWKYVRRAPHWGYRVIVQAHGHVIRCLLGFLVIGKEGDCFLCPPAAWGHCCSVGQEHLLLPTPRTRVLAREIVSNVGWAALPHALFCIKHFPPWKLPWLTAHFKIIINVFAQGFWNLISLFWTALSVFV